MGQIKISELIPKDAPLSTSDLLLIAQETPDGFESRSITGAEIVTTAQEGRQATLVSGTNIKTINGNSLLGSGDLVVGGGGLTIGTTAITSGTIGRILFEGTGNVLQESANLFWDNTNSRLGINTALPNMALDIRTGNVGIGVTSDAGFKLDVNGTARVSGQITGQAQFTNSTPVSTNAILLNGISTTDANTRSLVNLGTLSSTGILFGAIGIQATLQNNSVGSLINTNTVESIGHMVNATSGNVAVNGFMVRTNGQGTGGSIGFTWRVGNSTFFNHSVYNDGTFYNLKLFNRTGDIYYVRDRDTTNITFGSSVYQASAQVAVDSTTKGFLPPRMTTTQKNAIASPATGLIVYDTTLNKLCVRTASAWETITSV